MMLRKTSLSAMIFTYLFAGISHFTKFGYFLSIAPAFLPRPYASALVGLTGLLEILFSLFLIIPISRRGACYGILLFWSMALPINLYVLSIGGAGIPLPHWQLVGMVPFHLALMLWAYWHILREKKTGAQDVPFGAASKN